MIETLGTLAAAGHDGVLVTCLGVDTFVRVVGQGSPVFVVHGGPGFSHDYLSTALSPLTDRRTLIYYDQPGCGRSGQPPEGATAAFVFQHAGALLEALWPPEGRVGVIAHSWGCLVAIAAHASLKPGRTFNEGLLIAPVAVRRAEWDVALNQLLRRIPEETVTEFLRSLDCPGGADFSLIAPYYWSKPPTGMEACITVSGQAYRSAVETLGAFDHRGALGAAVQALTIMLAADDFTTVDLLTSLITAAAAVHVVEGGHFPFWETPTAFDRFLNQAFS